MNPTSLPNSERIKARIAEGHYWFHRIELPEEFGLPGGAEPTLDKPPSYGLPADMAAMPVL